MVIYIIQDSKHNKLRDRTSNLKNGGRVCKRFMQKRFQARGGKSRPVQVSTTLKLLGFTLVGVNNLAVSRKSLPGFSGKPPSLYSAHGRLF